MKLTKKSVLTGAIALLAIPLAYAASVHFKTNPTFADQGLTLKSCFSLAGLGNQDVTITIETTGLANTTCTSPGGNIAPGQNRTPVSPSAQVTIPSTQIRNGNLSVCLTTAVPPAPSPSEAGCPNSNWHASLNDVSFQTAKITVIQGGSVVLTRTFNL